MSQRDINDIGRSKDRQVIFNESKDRIRSGVQTISKQIANLDLRNPEKSLVIRYY
jgi:hypothetical protein